MIVVAGALLLRPRSVRLFTGVMLTKIAFVVAHHPFTPNHVFFESLVDVTAIAVLAVEAWRARGRLDEAAREHIVERLGPPAQISLLLLYGFAVLHKLNRDFLDPEVSCGPFLYELLVRRFSLPVNDVISALTIWGTLGVELAIPIGLLFSRTRLAAILLGVVFHASLAQLPGTGLYSFATMVFGLYTFFLPPSFPGALHRRLGAMRTPAPAQRTWLVLAAIAILAVVGLVADRYGRLLDLGLVMWNTWLLVIAWLVWGTRHAFVRPPTPIRFLRPAALLWLLPLAVLFNGLNPYMGLKTLTSIAMLSNLRTEGGTTNHLFMRRWIWLADYQDDLVEILDSNHPELSWHRDRQLLLTHHEFRRLVSTTTRDFYVRYDRAGTPHELVVANGTSSNPAVTRPLPRFAAWYLGFRPVDAGPRMRCRK